MDVLSFNAFETQFNGTLDELPFDILSLIFSFVLNIPFFGEKQELDTTRDKFSANRLSMVSSKFRKLVNTVCLNIIDEDRVRTAIFGCLRVNTFTDAIEMFEDNTQMLPFSLFPSLSSMVQFAICENYYANRPYIKSWIRYLHQTGDFSRFFARHFLNNHVWDNEYFDSFGHFLKVADGINFSVYNNILNEVNEGNRFTEFDMMNNFGRRGNKVLAHKLNIFETGKASVFEAMKEQYKQVIICANNGLNLNDYFSSYDKINRDTCEYESYKICKCRIRLTDAQQIFAKYDFGNVDHEQEYILVTIVIPKFSFMDIVHPREARHDDDLDDDLDNVFLQDDDNDDDDEDYDW